MSSVPPIRYVKNKSPVARIPKTRSAIDAPEENVVPRIIPGYRAGYSRYDAWLYVHSYRSGTGKGGVALSLFPFLTW